MQANSLQKSLRCAKCGKPPRDYSEIEPGAKIWFCKEHIGLKLRLNLLDFIKNRISVTGTEHGDRSRFVVRELVQNADDANASILVLRFEKDAMYVANNGRAFAIKGPNGEPGDFDRIGQVLKRYKEYDKESAGHFGSGFQTVYAITNRPEIHSSGQSQALNPVDMEWEALEDSDDRFSPYMAEHGAGRGVLFRLPWRDSKAAEADYDGDRPFSDAYSWPRWDAKAIREFYDDVKEYLSSVLLCCQRLKIVRVIWAAKGNSEAFQSSRNFTLEQPLANPQEVSLIEGLLTRQKSWFDWDMGKESSRRIPQSFDTSSSLFEKSRTLRYFAASAVVKDADGRPSFFVRGPNGTLRVDQTKHEGEDEIKKNFVHLLIPLFKTNEAFLYSVIPLPRRGDNKFAFSAHLIPTEARKEVDVEGNGGMNGRWYERCVQTVANRYREIFPLFLAHAQSLKTNVDEKQTIILQSLPVNEIGEWMRPGKGDVNWASDSTESLRNWLFMQPILATSSDTWVSPQDAYLPRDEMERRVIETLGLVAYPEAFESLCHDLKWLEARTKTREFGPLEFIKIWREILESNEPVPIRYKKYVPLSTRDAKLHLKLETLELMLRYAFSPSAPDESSSVSIVPDSKGELRNLSWFKKLPEKFNDLYSILSPSRRVHPDFADMIEDLERLRSRRLEVEVSGLPAIIDQAAGEQPSRFENLSNHDHKLLSQAAINIVLHQSFAPDQSKGLRFLPYELGTKIQIGSPPHYGISPPRGENYHRNWIFALHGASFRGLSKEVEAKIRFLSLADINLKDTAKLENKLYIYPLADKPNLPTNFIRHFVSEKHVSLFHDEALKGFLGIESGRSLDGQKKVMLEAIKDYFHDGESTENGLKPREMGSVPCLYDSDGDWFPAAEFLYGSESPSQFGFKALHPELRKWKPEILRALGVHTEIDAAAIAEKLARLAERRKEDSHALPEFLATLLKDYDPPKLSEIATKLAGVPWIPVGNLQIMRAPDTIYPTKSALEILGPGNQHFIDLDGKTREVLQDVGQKQLEQRIAALEIRTQPSLSEMSLALVSASTAKREPPAELLKSISRAISGLDSKTSMEWSAIFGNSQFYWKDEWFDGEMIRIVPEGPLPTGMSESKDVLVLSQDDAAPFEAYLRAIGARTSFAPADFLSRIVSIAKQAKSDSQSFEKNSRTYEDLWNGFQSMNVELPPELASEYFETPVLLTDGRWYAPRDVLLDDGEITDSPIAIGNCCILPADSGKWVGLYKLGARLLTRMSGENAQVVLRRFETGNQITEKQARAVLQILRLGSKQHWWRRDHPMPCPIAYEGRISLRVPTGCYLANSALLRHLPKVPLVVVLSDGLLCTEVLELARDWGAKSLASEIKYEGAQLKSDNRIRELEFLITDVFQHLVSIYETEGTSIDWLRHLEIYSVDQPKIQYNIGRSPGQISQPIIVPLGFGRLALLVNDSRAGFSSAIAELIANWSIGEGFPERQKGTLVRTMLEYSKTAESLRERETVQIPGYYETLDHLKSWYSVCQICGYRTPYDEYSGRTQEEIRSIVSKTGMLRGELESYTVGNVLYLCPRHATLTDRGLVRIEFLKDWERDKEQVKVQIKERITQVEDNVDVIYSIAVFESNIKDGKPDGWRPGTLTLTPEHARALLERIARYAGEEN